MATKVDLEAYSPFASTVSKGTGLDFYTVLGWVGAEGGPQDDPLNIMDGHGHVVHYGTMDAAATATVKNLDTKIYASVIQAANAKYPSQDAAIAGEAHAIAQSPWNDPSGKGSATRAQYEQNIDAGALQALYEGIQPGGTYQPATPQPAGKPATGGGGYVPPAEDPTGLAGLFNSIGAPFAAIGDAFAWITDPEHWKDLAIGALGLVLVAGGAFIALR